MDAAIVGLIGRIAPLLFGFLKEKHKILGNLDEDIKQIQSEFEIISAFLERADDCFPPCSSNKAVYEKWIELVRDLARAIEDCIDSFTHRVTLESDASWPARKVHGATTVFTRLDFAKEIRKLRKRSDDACKQREKFSIENGTAAAAPEPEVETPVFMANSVGMVAAQDELMALINETPEGQEKKLKVISIVGCGGIGKSQLANYAYDAISKSRDYQALAWIRDAGKGVNYALGEIVQQLEAAGSERTDSGTATAARMTPTTALLRERLMPQRFFIVIDDMCCGLWDEIKSAFPVVSGISSRVLVTTTTHSIATKCSIGDGHVYVMRTLDKDHSEKLFFQEASLHPLPKPCDMRLVSQVIDKCDGLPLALVTTARVLCGNPEAGEWEHLGENLGEYLVKNVGLVRMNDVLVRSYASLGSQEIKTCLLYLGSIYPSGHPIRRGKVIRKWLAEGLINEAPTSRSSSLTVAIRNFDKLVDKSIIQPIIDISNSNNSAVVKSCQTHGMMHEFILHKSMCQNFVILLYGEDRKRGSNIRWLSVQRNARSKMDQDDLRLVRSLTIFGGAHSTMLDFSKYKLMKVLDLEECRVEMGDSHLKDICSNLVLLRYLSLGAAVKATSLPEEIKMLIFLETLDVRRTKIEILPTQAIELPCLVHLFGNVKLHEDGIGDTKMRQLEKWLSNNSKLETLAGFVVDKSQEMPQLIEYMKHLTKVKIWCGFTRNSDKINHLRKAIKEFIQRGTGDPGCEAPSLSLNFDTEWPQDLLYFTLDRDQLYFIRSLKLQGKTICSTLPWFLIKLGGLTKLCLSFPAHVLSGKFLAVLKRVEGLKYLKLIAKQVDDLVIGRGEFKSLERLCVMVEVMTGLQVQEGAMPCLESLWLLCKDLNGFSAKTVESLPLLKEVALHNILSSNTKHEWKQAAKNHPRRPRVLFKLKGSEAVAVEIEPAMLANDTSTQLDSVPIVSSGTRSEPATTTDNFVSLKAIANAQNENHVDGQYYDHENKYNDNTDDLKNFPSKNSLSTSIESSGKEIRGEDHTQERCIVDPVENDIQEVMDMVRGDGALYSSDVYFYASQLFMQKEYRYVFKTFKRATAEERLEWIKRTWAMKAKI